MIWVRQNETDPKIAQQVGVEGANESEENKTKDRSYKNLVHLVRVATTIEGGVEAPIQFLIQVSLLCVYLL